MSFHVSFCSCVFQSFWCCRCLAWGGGAGLGGFCTFVRFALVWICRFPLLLGVWEGLRFVIVALPGLFSYLFLQFVIVGLPGLFSYPFFERAVFSDCGLCMIEPSLSLSVVFLLIIPRWFLCWVLLCSRAFYCICAILFDHFLDIFNIYYFVPCFFLFWCLRAAVLCDWTFPV